MSRRSSVLIAVVLGPLLGAGLPFIDLALDCRRPHSEACVWGKSLLPVSITVSTVVFGTLFAVALYFALEWRRRRAASA
jgi:hypothetical protein